jgi:PKD repeat protein
MYQEYHDNPLQASATEQARNCSPVGVQYRYTPFPVYVGVQTTFTASVEAGDHPFDYDWHFGDDGSSESGSSVQHTFAQTGIYHVTLTVSNACGSEQLERTILVFEPGSAELIFLPVVFQAGP